MRISTLFLFLCIFTTFAGNTHSQNAIVNIRNTNMTITDFIDQVERQTDYLFVYSKNELDISEMISLKTGRKTVTQCLSEAFENTRIKYAFENDYIVLTTRNLSIMQQSSKKQITGTVTDEQGEAIIGANVSEKGTANGIVTDVDGHFTLTVAEDAVLRVSYIGYIMQEIAIGNRTSINIVLMEDTQALDEVIVIGYGTQKKANLSGAVAAISSESLENRPVTNANLALQGLAPGLNISVADGAGFDGSRAGRSGAGRANAAPDINIRGTTSLNGGSAFILVDNVPVSANEFARMNPADIESVSLLQDAASAAIYGARAAFGVVLVTTKTAKSEKLQVDFDATYGIRELQPMADLITDPYLFMTEVNAAIYPEVRYTDAQVAYAKRRSEDPSLPDVIIHPNDPNLYDYYAVNNWPAIIYRKTSPTYNANLRVSQKTEKLTYTLSGAYYQQDGMLAIANDVMKRYNFRGKGTYRFTNWWEVGSNISFVTSSYDYPSTLDHSYYQKTVVCRPLYPVYNPDGSYTEMGADVYGLIPEGGRTDTQLNETQVSFQTTVDLLKDVWNIKGDANFRRTNTSTDKNAFATRFHDGPDLGYQMRNTDGRTYNQVTSGINNYTALNVYTDFHKTFADKHYLQALAGFNQEYLYINDYWVRRDDLITNSLPSFQLATGTVSQNQAINELALRGFFFRLNYIFNNRYILEFDGRMDGSSRFPKKSRWGFFPAGSAAWIVSREKFFSGINDALRISNLKFRGSYGELGNQVNNSYYPYLSTMSAGNINTRLDGSYPMGIDQPGVVAGNLTWEKVRTVNLGLDLGLFENRFDLTANMYTRYTEGMLTASHQLPAFFGAYAPMTNAADLKTKGWDVSVGYTDRVNVNGSPLTYALRFMLWDSRSWITKYDNPTGSISWYDSNGEHSSYRTGQELGEIWGYHTAGFFSSNEEVAGWANQSAVANHVVEAGDLKFLDLNKDGYINRGDNTIDNPGDRTIIGNRSPRYRYSLEGTAAWKGFDLRIFLHGIGKRDYAINNHRNFWGTFDSSWVNANTAQLDRWTPENPNGYLPKLRAGLDDLRLSQTKYLQDASWMRIKNLTVGYTLPDALMSKWKISRLRVYLSAENMWTMNKLRVKWVDPEILEDEYYPMQKVWSMGVSLNF